MGLGQKKDKASIGTGPVNVTVAIKSIDTHFNSVKADVIPAVVLALALTALRAGLAINFAVKEKTAFFYVSTGWPIIQNFQNQALLLIWGLVKMLNMVIVLARSRLQGLTCG